MERKSGAAPTLNLMGNFHLAAGDGASIEIRERKGKALLAMVATERNMRRSRHWLKSRLWSRTCEPQCSYSLRQTLHKLRTALAPHGTILFADRDYVWLRNLRITQSEPGDRPAEFFEDAPQLDEPFEDWLREERALHSEPLGPETGNVIGVFTRPRLVGTDKSEETWQDRIA